MLRILVSLSLSLSSHLGVLGDVVVGVVVRPEVGDDVAVAEGHLGRRLGVRVGRPGEERAG